MSESWSVMVARDGEPVITIEPRMLAGRDLQPGDAEVIEDAARNLLGFIGARDWVMPEWQPIETVPKDGRTVLLFHRAYGVAYWSRAKWESFADGSAGWIGSSFHSEPGGNWTSLLGEALTHWMPIPDAPSAATGRREPPARRAKRRAGEDVRHGR